MNFEVSQAYSQRLGIAAGGAFENRPAPNRSLVSFEFENESFYLVLLIQPITAAQ